MVESRTFILHSATVRKEEYFQEERIRKFLFSHSRVLNLLDSVFWHIVSNKNAFKRRVFRSLKLIVLIRCTFVNTLCIWLPFIKNYSNIKLTPTYFDISLIDLSLENQQTQCQTFFSINEIVCGYKIIIMLYKTFV